MTGKDEFIGLLEDYLDDEGPTPLPDVLRDAIRAELPTTKQVRLLPGTRRVLTVTMQIPRPVRYGLMAAVAVVALGVGVGITTRGTGTSSPTPTPAATSSPVPSAIGMVALTEAKLIPSQLGAQNPDNIAPGTYFLENAYPAHLTVDVPAGWIRWGAATDYNGILVDSPDALGGSGWGVVFSVVGPVSVDPCNQTKGTRDATVSRTVEAVAAAMAAWPAFEVRSAHDITVDGHPGRVLTITTKLDHASCPSPKLWTTPEGAYWENAYGAIGDVRHSTTYRLVQVADSVLAIRSTEFSNTSPYEIEQGIPDVANRHADDLPTLREIIDSVRIEAP